MRFIRLSLAGVLVGVLAACGGSTTLVATPPPSTSEARPDVVQDLEVEETPAEEATTANPDPSPSLGTRQRPAPIGSTVLINDASGQPVWEVTLLDSVLNVNALVAKENQFNDPPPDGYQFASATLSLTYLGADKGFPDMDIAVAFVSAMATTHVQSDLSVVGPDELSDENELYQGGNVVGSVYIAIPSEEAAAGTWRISQFLNDSEFFFAAK